MRNQMGKVALMTSALLAFTVICGLKISMTPSLAETEDAQQQKSETSSVADMVCPKCKGTMIAGNIRDYFDNNSYQPAMWQPAGEKQHLFSWGKYSKITAYRCSNCGYLELYAK